MKFFLAISILFFALAPVHAYRDSVVIEESNFQQLAAQMKKQNKGLLLMFHTASCAYCGLLDENILSPMEKSGEYNNRIFIRKIQIDKADLIADFSGRLIEASEMADSYDSNFTPTLVFLNHQGKQKAIKIIGINSIDLFSATVDQQIDILMQTIKTSNTIN